MRKFLNNCRPRDWRTTVVGALIALCIVGAMAAVFMGNATLTEAGSFIGVIVGILSAIGFVMTRDGKNRDGLLLVLFGLVLCSCNMKQYCDDRFPPSERIEIKETIIRHDSILPGAVVYDTLVWHHYHDSLVAIPKYKIIRDSSGLAELRYQVDRYGRLLMQCSANPRVLEVIERHLNTVQTQVDEVKVPFIPWWLYLLIGLLVLALLVSLKNTIKNLF